MDTPSPNPAPTEPIMQFFAFEHLPPAMQEVSRPFGDAERTVALRKLLESKDAAVRAAIAK